MSTELPNVQKSNEDIFITVARTSWDQWTGRATKLFDSLSDEEMLKEIAPGKNRPIYVLGHLIAVNDSMIPQLRLGEAAYPELREVFVTNPDSAAINIPSPAELRQIGKDLNLKLSALFQELTPAQWLERHSTITEEDFVKEPHRNRLAILLSRTAHISYHVGQIILIAKPR